MKDKIIDILVNHDELPIEEKAERAANLLAAELSELTAKHQKQIIQLQQEKPEPIAVSVETVTNLLKKQNEAFNAALDTQMNRLILKNKKGPQDKKWR